jgi:biopolymer transport protein ExbD
METRDHFKNGANLKSQKSKGKSMFMLVVLAIFIVSCGNVSKKIKDEVENIIVPKLNTEQFNFCENFFIAIQVKKIVNNDKWAFSKIDSDEKFQAVTTLLSIIKSNGFEDVINAFLIPREYNYEQKKAYAESILQDLEINAEQSFQSGHPDAMYDIFGFLSLNMNDVFQLIYSENTNSKLKTPELKTTLVETLDNGNEIWLVQDYQSMTQARLIVKKDGGLSIGNLTDLETVITR